MGALIKMGHSRLTPNKDRRILAIYGKKKERQQSHFIKYNMGCVGDIG